MQNGAADLNPDRGHICRCRSGWAGANGSISSGTNAGAALMGTNNSPLRARRRHPERYWAIDPCFAATSQTRARLKTLTHDPRLEVVGPETMSPRPIKNLYASHPIRPMLFHPVLILVLHGRPPANSVAERHARCSIWPKTRGYRTAYDPPWRDRVGVQGM